MAVVAFGTAADKIVGLHEICTACFLQGTSGSFFACNLTVGLIVADATDTAIEPSRDSRTVLPGDDRSFG